MHPDQGYGVGSNYWQEDDRELTPIDRAQRKKRPNVNIFYVGKPMPDEEPETEEGADKNGKV